MKRPAEDEALEPAPSSSKMPKPASIPSSSSRIMQGRSGEKHSLDSDEEEGNPELEDGDESGGNWLSQNNEGEEAETVRADGEIPITPSNLNEEKSEGNFTKDGDFVWKKDKDDSLHDSWLESVDWSSIHEKTRAEKERREAEDDQEDELEAGYDEMKAYSHILEILKPGESVAGALRRLGGGSKSGGKKKRPLRPWEKPKNPEEAAELKANKELMLKLSGLADSILSRSGNMEVYEETFEGISFKIKSQAKVLIPEGTNDDDALDMFASSLDDEKKAPNEKKAEETDQKKDDPMEDEVSWEFKWEDKEDAEIHGPHSSKEMLEWQESGFFENGVFARKVGTDSSFSSSRRIDFELYT
uniref:CD2 antigen cytoplasmic tail-binding protein 2 n=1 Tax=Caligus rogercresseyi TaxID=217165 RepID=C1BMK6_CALRO|nr:CD2 antigen cytoplasmic tail-binding protein 2 [Caligus rogercresseyi]